MPTIVQLEKLILIDPKDPFGHYGLGQELAKAKDHAGAIECYDKVIELDPSYCYAYYFKAQSLHALGQTDDAQRVLNDGLDAARKANDAKAISELSVLLQSIG